MSKLDAEQIATAALDIVDKKGLAGFTMRTVAEALGVTAMALYHHVQDKAALAALIVDAAIRKNPLPPSTGKWRDDLWTMANWMRENTLAHPAFIHLRRAYHVWTSATLTMTERWLSLWQQSGLDLEKAVLAAKTSSMAITGFVDEEMISRELLSPDDGTLSLLPNARVMFESGRNREIEFELAVKSLIDGLFTRLSKK